MYCRLLPNPCTNTSVSSRSNTVVNPSKYSNDPSTLPLFGLYTCPKLNISFHWSIKNICFWCCLASSLVGDVSMPRPGQLLFVASFDPLCGHFSTHNPAQNFHILNGVPLQNQYLEVWFYEKKNFNYSAGCNFGKKMFQTRKCNYRPNSQKKYRGF